MLLTGEQIASLQFFADGSDCRVSKLAGVNSAWAQAVRSDEVMVWINPLGQIMDFHPSRQPKQLASKDGKR